MKCRNSHIFVNGFCCNGKSREITKTTFDCTATNDEIGKTLSISNGELQFTIPFEPLEKYLKD